MFHKFFPLIEWFRKLTTPEIADIVNSSMYPSITLPVERAKLENKLPDFEKMSKKELDIWAHDNLGLNIDRRRKKIYIIEQIKQNINIKES